MDVPILSAIVAKVLVLVERLMDEWVTLSVTTWAPFNPNCGPNINVSGDTTVCGDGLIEIVEDMVQGGVGLVVQILGGIGVTETF